MLQPIFDTYMKKMAYIFTIQPMIYLLEKLKCKYTGQFLESFSFND